MMHGKERLESLKGYLRNYVETITQRSKSGMYICPLCGSGTGANHTGAFSIHKDGIHWRCFSCNRTGDIFDLYKEINGCDLSEATKGIIGLYESAGAQMIQPVLSRKAEAEAPKRRQDFREPIERFETAMPGSKGEEYLISRGLKTDTLRRFRIGYDAAENVVTIPYDRRGSYYIMRAVDPARKYQHEKLEGVECPLFNPGALYAGEVCFVVESPLCAISIAQEGGQAVALSGTGGKYRLTDQLKKKPTAAALVLCLDNDGPGRKANGELGEMLEEMGVFYVNGTAAIMGDVQDEGNAAYRKDPNEVLQKDGDAVLRQAVMKIAEEARQQCK